MKQFSNAPCWTEEQIIERIFVKEAPVIARMIQKGYPVKEMIHHHSETTGETHIFPIFVRDSVEDIVNRYADLFPLEIADYLQEVVDQIEMSEQANAMSQDRNMMMKMKCPIALYRALKSLDDDFWHDQRNIKYMLEKFPKLTKVSRPKGST